MSIINKLPMASGNKDDICIYTQIDEPETKDGIWIKTNNKLNNIIESRYSKYFVPYYEYNNIFVYGENDNCIYYKQNNTLYRYNKNNSTTTGIYTITDSDHYTFDNRVLFQNDKFIIKDYSSTYNSLHILIDDGSNTNKYYISTYYSVSELCVFLNNNDVYLLQLGAGDGTVVFSLYKLLPIGNGNNDYYLTSIKTITFYNYTLSDGYYWSNFMLTDYEFYDNKLYLIAIASAYQTDGIWGNSIYSIGVYDIASSTIKECRLYDSAKDMVKCNNKIYYIYKGISKLNSDLTITQCTNDESGGLYSTGHYGGTQDSNMFSYNNKLYFNNGECVYGLPKSYTVILNHINNNYEIKIANTNNNNNLYAKIYPVNYFGASKFEDVELYYGYDTKWNKSSNPTYVTNGNNLLS